jgi:putative ABC transport system permease protein
MAAALMRPKAPKVGKRVLLERIPFVWNRLKFLDKVSVRNLFRYKKRFLMMIIGVSGCTALLVTGMGVKDSIATIADTQYGTIALYDMVVVTEEDIAVEGVKESMRVSSKSADMEANNKVKGVSILVPEDLTEVSSFMNLHTEEGETVAMPNDGEILMSYNMAESFKVEVGDELSLQNEELTGGTVVVSGIYENYFDHFVVTPKLDNKQDEPDPTDPEPSVNPTEPSQGEIDTVPTGGEPEPTTPQEAPQTPVANNDWILIAVVGVVCVGVIVAAVVIRNKRK